MERPRPSAGAGQPRARIASLAAEDPASVYGHRHLRFNDFAQRHDRKHVRSYGSPAGSSFHVWVLDKHKLD